MNHSPTSLRASSQIQLFFFFFDNDCRALSCLQEKKKKGQGRRSKIFFSSRSLKTHSQAGLITKAMICNGEGLEVRKMLRTFHGLYSMHGTSENR